MSKASVNQSAKQRFISFIEQRIISGELKINQKLPPERELAEQACVSRVTVHAALVELASKNVLRIVPRQGTFINDFKKENTLELYGALMQHTGAVDAELLSSLLAFREIVEVAAAELAAAAHSSEDIESLRGLLRREREAAAAGEGAFEAARLDFALHLGIARASGNIVLPMTLRSIEAMYMTLVRTFYEALPDRGVVYAFHERLIAAIDRGEKQAAGQTMKAMLDHGRSVLTDG
jgi:DNA-binding FadR family transcriptional regulator